ncbi:MAG: acetylglutamate kinase [Candidatus Caenarcaniphilales bacterium]|nr:acetylglutamate kinase [Candidatus Caenarcaniphilales bacterium]
MSPQTDIDRVKILAEALPYIQKFHSKIFVIKYGGSALTDPEIEKSTINDLVLLNSVGIKVVLVHGGGPEINKMLEKLGKEIKFENGLRHTDSETMEVVEMVLHGKVQRRLVSAINTAGAKAFGFSGRDGRIMIAKRHSASNEGNMVGEIKSSSLDLIHDIHKLGMIPVISSIAPDENGQAYNINADSMAAELAISLQADKLMLMTDTPGILLDKNNPESLIKEMDLIRAEELVITDVVQGGMIPKTECCIKSIKAGVQKAVILNGLQQHSLLLDTFTDAGSGTMICY